MITCVFGRRGEGKTTWIKNHIIKPSPLPCIIVDTLNEYEKEAVLMNVTDDIIFNNFKVRFRPETDLDFEILCRCISNNLYRFGLNVIVSEVDFWTSSYQIPYTFLNCLRYSRHYRLNIICDVRNPVELNRKISALADRFIIFKITEPRYLDYFKGYDIALPSRISNLKTHHYVEYIL